MQLAPRHSGSLTPPGGRVLQVKVSSGPARHGGGGVTLPMSSPSPLGIVDTCPSEHAGTPGSGGLLERSAHTTAWGKAGERRAVEGESTHKGRRRWPVPGTVASTRPSREAAKPAGVFAWTPLAGGASARPPPGATGGRSLLVPTSGSRVRGYPTYVPLGHPFPPLLLSFIFLTWDARPCWGGKTREPHTGSYPA